MPREVSTDRLIKDTKRVLENPFWIQTLHPNTNYSRLHDDHDGTCEGTLNVFFDPMGDAFVSIEGPRDRPQALCYLRFRTFGGGGMSQRTRNALMILAEAMRLDNVDCPPGDPSVNRPSERG